MSKVLLLIKELRHNTKNSLLITTVSIFVLIFLFSVTMFMSYSDNVNKGLAQKLIRLHVIANSDSPKDQQLKRDIRDLIITHMEDKLKSAKDIEQTRFIINQNMNDIEKIAIKEISNRGEKFPVKATLGNYQFPTKLYGDITLPAGKYEALKVVIGKGEGANWWCVLFPPLCFVDATHGTVPDSVKQELRNTLSKEEYKLISSKGEKDIPVHIRFKVVEFFQGSKIKFSGIMSNIFK